MPSPNAPPISAPPPSRSASLIGAISLTLGLGLLYEAPLRRGALLNYDDTAVLGPMQNIRSLMEYQAAREQNLILDVQPLRDALSWLEFRLQEWTGFYNPQLINFGLWLLILGALGGLLMQAPAVRARTRSLVIGLFLIGAHPVAVNSVAWPSARKHLLAALFILIATTCWMLAVRSARSQREPWATWGWAALAWGASAASGLAQPIHLLWTFWSGFFLVRLWSDKLISRALTSIWTLNLLTTLILLKMNWTYYSGATYAARSGAAKLGNETWFLWWSDRWEALGRYLMQIVFPIAPSIASYQRHHPLNLIGGALLVLLVGYVFFRWRQRAGPRTWNWRTITTPESPAFWLSLASLPLLLVHARSTEHLGWDTYLLFPWLMLGALGISSFCQRESVEMSAPRPRSLLIFMVAAIALLWSVQTWQSARAWSDEGRLWSTAVARGEKTLALSGWSRWALQNNEIDRGCEAALELFDLHPRHRDLDYLLGLCFYSLGQKYRDRNPLELFVRVSPPADTARPWFDYYWAVTEMNRGQPEAAYERLRRLWHSRHKKPNDESGDDFIWRFAFAELTSGLAANSLIICCRRQPAAVCGALREHIRSNTLPQHWDAQLWSKTLAQASLPDDPCRKAITSEH